MVYTAAIVGTGTPSEESGSSFGMAYKHAEGYRRNDAVELVGCADRNPERATEFADRYDLDRDAVFESHGELLASLDPDVLSVTVQPASHEDIVSDAVRSGVAAIHCEKPMAPTVGASRRMTELAERYGVQLTFNHQRRYGKPFREAKRLLDDGAIGALDRVEFAAPNLYDYGSHSFDLCNYYADEADPSWVLAGIDYTEENVRYGVHNENRAIVQWRYENGGDGLATTGSDATPMGCHNRLIGSEGVVELGPAAAPDVELRVREHEGEWTVIDTGDEGMHEPMATYVRRAIDDVVASLDADTTCELRAENALRATELVFGAWESARRTGRVDLPLDITDNPLVDMVESGRLRPDPAE